MYHLHKFISVPPKTIASYFSVKCKLHQSAVCLQFAKLSLLKHFYFSVIWNLIHNVYVSLFTFLLSCLFTNSAFLHSHITLQSQRFGKCNFCYKTLCYKAYLSFLDKYIWFFLHLLKHLIYSMYQLKSLPQKHLIANLTLSFLDLSLSWSKPRQEW